VRLCRAFAERQGWTVVTTFEDAARSGFGIEHRPGYQQLLAAALGPAHPFEVILVEDLSRLTRDMAEALRLYHRLRLKGVDLVGVSDGIATGRQGGKVQLAVKGLVNELYLDDLREKTHRGLSGQVTRGFSAGRRTFGYRTVAEPGHRARVEVDEREAEIVRHTFRRYAAGRSMRAIAHALNTEGVPSPAKDTKRGPARRGWALSTVQVTLRNERYVGVLVWNKTKFLKDPESGRRRAVARPADEWVRQVRPELRIIEDDLWNAVHDRSATMAERFGGGRPGHPATVAYSPHLLSGLVCALRRADARSDRDTPEGRRVYVGTFCTCGFAQDKGPAVCQHRAWYQRDFLEQALIRRLREATTPAMVEAVARTVNAHLEAARERDSRLGRLKAEALRLEVEAGNLVQVLAQGFDSPTVRGELEAIETALRGIRVEIAAGEGGERRALRVHNEHIRARIDQLGKLLGTDPARARFEITKHLDGDMTVAPLPDLPARPWRCPERPDEAKQPPGRSGPRGCFRNDGCGGAL
jgi:DNA invertase Pin-like site-specific DNA recombinase